MLKKQHCCWHQQQSVPDVHGEIPNPPEEPRTSINKPNTHMPNLSHSVTASKVVTCPPLDQASMTTISCSGTLCTLCHAKLTMQKIHNSPELSTVLRTTLPLTMSIEARRQAAHPSLAHDPSCSWRHAATQLCCTSTCSTPCCCCCHCCRVNHTDFGCLQFEEVEQACHLLVHRPAGAPGQVL